MSIKAFLTSKGLDDDHWFEEMEKLKEVLHQQERDYEEANKVWTQHDAEHTLAQSIFAAAQQISDAAGSQYRNTLAAAGSALARLQSAKENLAKCEKAEKEIIETVQKWKTFRISALVFLFAAFFFENFVVNSEKSWILFPSAWIPSACIGIVIACVFFCELAWFVQPAASKDVSEIKKRTLAAMPPAAEAEHAHSLLEDQARGEQQALDVAQKRTDLARQVLDGIERKLGEALRDKDAKQKVLVASEAKYQQHQLHFDQTKMHYEAVMAFDEKLHNVSLAAKCEAASREVCVSDAAAAAAYDLAAAAWSCVAAMEEKGAHVKPKMKKAETETFDYFFKQKMDEETKRRLQRDIDIQKEIERRNQQNRPKRKVRSASSDWNPEGLEVLGDFFFRPKERGFFEEDRLRSDEGSNPGGCSGMDTSVPPCPVQ